MLPIRFAVLPDSKSGADPNVMWDVQPLSANLTVVDARPAASTLSLTMQDGSAAAAQLRAGGEVAVQVQDGSRWREIPNARFCAVGYTFDQVARALDTTGGPVDVTSTFTPTLVNLAAFRLGPWGAVVWSDTPLDTDKTKRGQRHLGPATAGACWNRLRSEVQAAGYCSGLDLACDETVDDNGDAWVASKISRTYDVGTPLVDVMNDMISKGDARFLFDGVHLQVTNPDRDTSTDTVATLRLGAELLSASYTSDQSQLASGACAIDGTGYNINNVVPTDSVDFAWGKRQTAVHTDHNTGTVDVAAKVRPWLDLHQQPKVAVTADVNLQAGVLPFLDYTAGDRVQVLLVDGPADTRRVRQISLSIDERGGQAATLIFDHRRMLPQEWIVAQIKKLPGAGYGVPDIG